jgi:arylformamidase
VLRPGFEPGSSTFLQSQVERPIYLTGLYESFFTQLTILPEHRAEPFCQRINRFRDIDSCKNATYKRASVYSMNMLFDLFQSVKVIDLSHEIKEGMTVYIGDPAPKIKRVKTIDKNGVNLSKVIMGVHNGTHVDSPFHFIKNGITADEIPIERFLGKALTIDFSDKEAGSGISLTDLKKYEDKIDEGIIVLLYTGISKHWNEEWSRSKFTYLSKEAAEWLADKNVKGVGIDCLSIEKFGSKNGEVHKALLKKNIFIIESLNSSLEQLVGKEAMLFCLPIYLKGTDGAPARVIGLVEN